MTVRSGFLNVIGYDKLLETLSIMIQNVSLREEVYRLTSLYNGNVTIWSLMRNDETTKDVMLDIRTYSRVGELVSHIQELLTLTTKDF
jgi:hypothetical protein